MDSDRGSAAIEMALVLPVLLVVFLAIAEFGNLMFTKLTLTNAAMMGARAGITALTATDAIAQAEGTAAASLPTGASAIATIIEIPVPRRIQVDVSYSYEPILGNALFSLLKTSGPGTWDLAETAVMSFNN